MKAVAVCLPVALGLVSVGVLAQSADDSMDKLRACSQLPQSERLECLDKLSREITLPSARPAASPPVAAQPAADNWVVSETTSPVDYAPVVVATATSSGGANGAVMQLSIQCRSGATTLMIRSPGLDRTGATYTASYRVNDGQPVSLAASTSPAGAGVAMAGDVVRMLASLPDQGEITFSVAAREGTPLEGRYSLAGLKTLRDRLATPCKWATAAGARKTDGNP